MTDDKSLSTDRLQRELLPAAETPQENADLPLGDDPSVEPEQTADIEVTLAEELQAAHDPTIDSIQTDLNEIGRVGLLNAAEEVELAGRMARGRAAERRLESGDDLTPRLRVALRMDAERGHEARHQIIQANLRLVVSIA